MRFSRLLNSLFLLRKHTVTSPLTRLFSLFQNHAMSTTTEQIAPSTTRVGWIGTGVMGRSMCAHILKAGYKLTVFNRTISKAQSLIDQGAHLANSPAEVASESDVVFTIVGFPSDVKSVTDGVLSLLRPGGILVDMTTSDPTLAVEIETAAAAKSCSAVDAPVSGGDRGARNAALSIFAGGDHAVVTSLSPLLSLLGKTYYMGGPGKGQYAKLANQITIASTMVGLVEGMIYAHKAKLDLSLFLEAISKGAAGSKSLELYGERILKRDLEAGFYVDHFVKDLGICLKECEKMGICLPGLGLAHQLYLSLKAHGEGGLGTQALVLALERLNNLSLGLDSSS
ncbi:probable 3-hydroxyisobutyrate dehydrogenase-like 1, mitochondrial [Amaranthus tricolor]|uniref:probable 3-hydroxyisobutyrate dehydrogenase-like 1, mitochondrial n=1 Tax=Amaranthus tricolor TaxID=29722 RepID=UPI00258471E4|nr:probable 3-hydroxyisobutyrate dehydrogenase-like 1, mitochondrial [Amaranthus tricolor]